MNMGYVIAVNARIRADRFDTLVQAITENAKASRTREPGCLQFDVLLDREDRHAMALYEVYADKAAFEAHQGTAHHKSYFTAAHDLLEARARTEFTRVVSPTTAKNAGGTMSVALIVNCVVQPEKLDALMTELTAVAESSRLQEPGCLQFDILTNQQDPTKVMLYEVYSDVAASEAHQKTAHFARFVERGLPLFASHQLRRFDRIAP